MKHYENVNMNVYDGDAKTSMRIVGEELGFR